MTFTLFFKHIIKNDVLIAGGKGASLGEMTNAGIPVPPGFIVLAPAFDRFIHETVIKSEIEARLSEVNPEDTHTIDRASNVLRDVIHDTPMPDDLSAEILSAFDSLGADLVAVRSSATAEDSEVASWAGELETYLNTTREFVVLRVKQCWSSLFTPRAIFYRHEKDLIDAQVSVAVVIQKMIQSEVSGICFTVHPVTEDRDQMIIEAGFGLGEAIVSGSITPDSYVIRKSDMTIIDVQVAEQGRKLVYKNTKKQEHEDRSVDVKKDRENIWVELAEAGNQQKLSGKQVVELARLCKKIEDHYGFPCDIEWAWEGGIFYITQSRPITTLQPLDNK